MPHRSFDPETVSVMGLALDAAWAEVERSTPVRAAPENPMTKAPNAAAAAVCRRVR